MALNLYVPSSEICKSLPLSAKANGDLKERILKEQKLEKSTKPSSHQACINTSANQHASAQPIGDCLRLLPRWAGSFDQLQFKLFIVHAFSGES